MQDYFKYDKIQTGTSLFMKSDSDGTTDKEKRALPLGIKTIGEGIKQITNWNHVSNSIDSNKGIRFEDRQPNTLLYSVKNRIATTYSDTDTTYLGIPFAYEALKIPLAESITNGKQNTVSFIDSWSANDINIIDDIAFVSYEDYSDLNREELDLGQISLSQPYRFSNEVTYDAFRTWIWRDYDASLIFDAGKISEEIKQQEILPKKSSNNLYLDNRTCRSNRFMSFDNTILKVEFQASQPTEEFSGFQKTLYFTYGGAIRNTNTFSLRRFDFRAYSNNYNTQSGTKLDSNFCPINYTNFNDGDYAGEFFLVTGKTRTRPDEQLMGNPDTNYEDNWTETLNDNNARPYFQLSVSALTQFFIDNPNYLAGPNITDSASFNMAEIPPLQYSFLWNALDYSRSGGIAYSTIVAKVTLIKFQPVRKCGKVDIYVRKSGIISGFNNNRFTSPIHNLSHNDIVKIDSALFDGEQTGAVDIHPLNGEKFVKYIDDNTFELYEDQYFHTPCSTNHLKSIDGIKWCCIGNANGAFGQGWSYSQTLFSPTGRNGYVSTTANNMDYVFDPSHVSAYPKKTIFTPDNNTFITSKRLGDATLNTNYNTWDNTYSNNSIVLDLSKRIEIYEYKPPDFLSYATLNTNPTVFGKQIVNFIESIPKETLGKSPFGLMSKGVQEFYPYHCQTDLGRYNVNSNSFEINNDLSGPYLGNKFGCSLDVKFSHHVGDSKIYDIIIGEKGSDISIDLYGCQDNELKVDGGIIPYAEELTITKGQFANIHSIFKTRVPPFFMPHGKIHVLTMTVDKYNRITNIAYKNTIFGDGFNTISSSFNVKTQYPFNNLYIDQLNENYKNYAFNDKSVIGLPTYTIRELAITYPTTLYWQRGSIANWFGPNIYDYYSNSTVNENLSTLYRDYIVSNLNRNSILTQPTFGNNRSYFGESAISSSYTPYPIIDRFGFGTNAKSQLHIIPWMDSFGKSVCIGEKTASGHLPIFGSSTVRSNINIVHQYSFRSGFTLSNSDTRSQIGQISCVLLNSSYAPIKLLEINDGGSIDSYNIDNDPSQVISVTESGLTGYRLRTGAYAGDGVNEVKSSLVLSAQKILFRDGTLIWGDQILSESKSKINILTYNHSNNSLTPIGQISKQFTTPRRSDARFVGDGFGWNIRYNDGILVTNSMTTQNEFGQDIATLLDGSTVDSYRVDSLSVFKVVNQNNVEHLQTIFPSFNVGDSEGKYTDKFLIDYKDSLLNIGNIHYDNFTLQSRTWNVRLLNSYDTIDDRVILRDPIGYSLFAIDYSFSSRSGFSTLNNTNTYSISPYLYFSEIFKTGEIYYDYSDKTSFLIRDTSIFNQTSTNTLSLQNNLTVTPVFFFNIPESNIDVYGNLTIRLTFDNLARNFFEKLNVNNFSDKQSILNNFTFNNTLPKIVLYKKDPRQTIIPNGIIGNTSTTPTTGLVTLENGKFVYSHTHRRIINPNDDSITWKQTVTRPPMFRGGAHDLHFYGDLGTSSIEEYRATLLSAFPNLVDAIPSELLNHYYGGLITLGQLYDATYNKNTEQGLISYVSNDVLKLLDDYDPDNISMYGKIISSNLIGGDVVEFTIPYSIWSEYIYQGSFVKSNNDNRPFINDFINIKHGTLSTTPSSSLSNPISGSWSQDYDDINRPSYDPDAISSNRTLALGLVLSSVFDLNYSSPNIMTSQAEDDDLLYLRSVSSKQSNTFGYKYSYNTVLATTSIEQKSIYPVLNKILNFDFSSTVLDISATVQSQNISKRKMQCVFNKVAYFTYNNSVYNEVQRNLLNANLKIDRYSFGKYEFVPLPVGVTRDRKLLLTQHNQPGISDHLLGQSKNPIIRVGKSNTDFSKNSNGASNKSAQIISSDSIIGVGEKINTTTYIDLNEDKVQTYYAVSGILDTAYIGANNLLGSMDLLDLDYVPLYIGALKQEVNAITLYTKDQSKRLETTLYVNGLQKISEIFSLFIGQPFRQTGITLNIEAPNFEFTSLFIYEVAPSAILPLSIATPDAEANLTLAFQPPATGQIPLVTIGPVLAPSNIPLHTRGLGYHYNTFRLVMPTHENSFGVSSLFVKGVTSQNNATTLFMNRPVVNDITLHVDGSDLVSQSLSLSFSPAIEVVTTDASLFIGTQFEVDSQNVTLAIFDTERPSISEAPLYINSFVDSANSIENGENSFDLQRSKQIVDISYLPDTYETTLTYNGISTTTNSLTRVSLTSNNQLLGKTKSVNATNVYLGSQNKLLENNNAAYITQLSDINNNSNRAFYRDESRSNFEQLNYLIKRDIYDSNGNYFVLGSKTEDIADIDIYEIVANRNVKFISKISLGLTKLIPGTSPLNDSLYGKNGIVDLPFGDSFVQIRRALKSYFSNVFADSDLNDIQSSIVVNDLKLSSFNSCAISLRVKLAYSNINITQTKTFNVVILFKISDIKTGTSNITSFVGKNTYYLDHYHYHILEESDNNENKYSAAYNLAFCQDDLYFERHNGQWGQVCGIFASENYSTIRTVIDYGEHPDVQNYISPNNAPYIPANRKKAGFGIPLKIYNEYRSDSHIMLIGAQLFDPFVFNTLNKPHNPNPIGAVYIYRLSSGSSVWSYVGAMYGKGNTSLNVIANLNDYTNSAIEDKEYCLFGFDFDYMDGNIAVSEPGGSGFEEINGGKIYLFNITDTTITLNDDYLISDITLPLGYSLNDQDNFGSYVVLIDKNTPITFSNSSAGNGLIHNLSSGKTLVASLAYTNSEYTTIAEARLNIENESQPYDPATINPLITTRSQHLLSMKKLNFGNSVRKLGLVREFRTRSIDSNFTFDLQKLFIMDLQPIGFTLFISGPLSTNNDISLQTTAHEQYSDTLYTSVYGAEPFATGLNITIVNNISTDVMPLYMEYVNNNATTLYIAAQIKPDFDGLDLFITSKDVQNNNATLWTSYAVENIWFADLSIKPHLQFLNNSGIKTVITGYDTFNNSGVFFSTSGAVLGDIYRTTPLFIGKEAHKNNNMSIFIDSFVVASGSEYLASGGSLYMKARGASIYDTFDSQPLYINGPDREYLNIDAPMFISAPMPEIAENGAFIHSGYLITTISGNNDSGAFFASEKYQTLNVVGAIANASGMSLYMERPTANALGLFIKDLNPTSIITTAISGAFYGSGSTDLCILGPIPSTGTFSLYIEQPQSNLTTLTTRGYLE